MLFTIVCKSQTIEVVDHVGVIPGEMGLELSLLSDKMGTDNIIYIGTVNGQSEDLKSLYTSMNYKSRYLGANLYKINSYSWNEASKSHTVQWEIYLGNEEITAQNLEFFGKNKVYVFSPLKKKVNYKVNGKEKSLEAFDVIIYDTETYDSFELNKGGILGHTLNYKQTPNRENIYLNFGNGGITAATPIYGGDIGFSSGVINYMESDYALFQTAVILKRKNQN